MKVLFIYPNQTGQIAPQLGIGYLSSILKNAGHETALFDTTYMLYEPFESIRLKLFSKIDKFHPDLIAFSCRSLEFQFAKSLAEAIKKKYSCKIIFGGIHATIQPDEVLASDAIDYICVGEGEKAMLQLVNNLNSDKKINNIWTRERRTPLNPLIQNLDSLPFPDRDLFKIPDEKDNLVMGSRGCPYNCSYCFNCALKRIYKGEKYVRFRKVDKILDEVRELVSKRKLKYIFFCDDVFTFDKKRLLEFCEKYSAEFKIPFSCNVRAEDIDEEIAAALKKANCIEAKIGIETGNEKLRRDILKKFISNDQIKRAFRICREAGVNTYATNMIGLPFETEDTIKQTFDLIRDVKTNFQVSILCPFKGTDIYETYEKNGYFKKKKQVLSYYEKSFATFPNISDRKLLAYQRFSHLYVKYPQFHSLINLLRILPLEKMNIFENRLIAKLYALSRRVKGGNATVDILSKDLAMKN